MYCALANIYLVFLQHFFPYLFTKYFSVANIPNFKTDGSSGNRPVVVVDCWFTIVVLNFPSAIYQLDKKVNDILTLLSKHNAAAMQQCQICLLLKINIIFCYPCLTDTSPKADL